MLVIFCLYNFLLFCSSILVEIKPFDCIFDISAIELDLYSYGSKLEPGH